MAREKLLVRDLSKRYRIDEGFGRASEVVVFERLGVSVAEGEFVTVIGPSGCGKSTFLMVLAGLVDPSGGEVLLEGARVEGPGLDRGVVFQDFAIFPWLTVRRNVAFGLEMKGVPRDQHEAIIGHYLRMVRLEAFADFYPHRLSGGMKQRVGIARALAFDPEVLLMDEPFGSLDAQTRASLQGMLLQIHRETGKTTLFVTHSVGEAAFLSTRVLVFSRRPASIIADVPVDVPLDGRDRHHPRLVEIERHLEALLADQMEQVDDLPLPSARPVRVAARVKGA